MLERDAFAAGSTALSSGFIPAPCTQAQQAQGITDSVAQFAADIQAKAHGQAAPHLVQAYAKHIGPAMDALAQHHGLPWQVLDNFLYPGHSAHRMHAVPEKTGAGLMSRLQAAADAAGVVLLTQAQVTELWADDAQRIHGVGFIRPDGQTERIRCDAVIDRHGVKGCHWLPLVFFCYGIMGHVMGHRSRCRLAGGQTTTMHHFIRPSQTNPQHHAHRNR